MMYINFVALIMGVGFWVQSGEFGLGILMWLILLGIGAFVYACFVHPLFVILAVVLGITLPGSRDSREIE